MSVTEQINHYEVLGVEQDADNATIKKAFRRIMRTNHPDIVGDDENAANLSVSATVAYEILSNPEKRAEYDAELRGEKTSSQTDDDGVDDFNPEQFEDTWGEEQTWDAPEPAQNDDGWGEETGWGEEELDDMIIIDDSEDNYAGVNIPDKPWIKPEDVKYSKPKILNTVSKYKLVTALMIVSALFPAALIYFTSFPAFLAPFGVAWLRIFTYVPFVLGAIFCYRSTKEGNNTPTLVTWGGILVLNIVAYVAFIFLEYRMIEMLIKAAMSFSVGYLFGEGLGYFNTVKHFCKTIISSKDLRKYNTYGKVRQNSVLPGLLTDCLDAFRDVPALRFINTSAGLYTMILIYGDKVAYVAPIPLDGQKNITWWNGMLVSQESANRRPTPVMSYDFTTESHRQQAIYPEDRLLSESNPTIGRFLVTFDEDPNNSPVNTVEPDNDMLPTIVDNSAASQIIAQFLQLDENKPHIDRETFCRIYQTDEES